jgi:rhamnogalacturonan endolyase
MQDPQYRLSIAWQNVAYNQPPHTSFYFGDGMKTVPKPNIVLVKPKESARETAPKKSE